DKIEARYAKALGTADLTSHTVEASMLEIEQAQMNVEAQSRLSELRTQLGLGSGNAEAPAPEVTAGQTEPKPAEGA
ncbi:MAG: hypothetical protein QOG64_797, partial [Acidimicrobiaceae bacterium]|nr:hypothetical protein [Acidimicrobiaceae bacterium]